MFRPTRGADGDCFTLCQKKQGKIIEIPAHEFMIPLDVLVKDIAIKILTSPWAQALSPKQAIPEDFRRIATPETQQKIITQNNAILDGVREGRGLRPLPETERSFLRDGDSIKYGGVEFYRMQKNSDMWGFRLNEGSHLNLSSHLLIDLACRILRDPYVKNLWPAHSIDFLGAFPSYAWSDTGRLIDPNTSVQLLDTEVDEITFSGLSTGSLEEDRTEAQFEIIRHTCVSFVESVTGLSADEREKILQRGGPNIGDVLSIAEELGKIPELTPKDPQTSPDQLRSQIFLREVEKTVTTATETIRTAESEALSRLSTTQQELIAERLDIIKEQRRKAEEELAKQRSEIEALRTECRELYQKATTTLAKVEGLPVEPPTSPGSISRQEALEGFMNLTDRFEKLFPSEGNASDSHGEGTK
jgi:hypothetical protein